MPKKARQSLDDLEETISKAYLQRKQDLDWTKVVLEQKKQLTANLAD